MKKFFSSMWVRIKSFVTFFWNHLDRLINIIVLAVSIIALWIAIKSMKNQNSQFEQNSKSSDSLFNVQLINSKEQNDSLISQIKSLQAITNKQLLITNEQFKIARQSLTEKIFENRPQIAVNKTVIVDTLVLNDEVFQPKISTQHVNKGLRIAYNHNVRVFIVTPDFKEIIYENSSTYNSDIEPTKVIEILDIPKIPIKYKERFYHCVEVSYFDKSLNQEFNQLYFNEYFTFGNKKSFYTCREKDVQLLKASINTYLLNMKVPLLK